MGKDCSSHSQVKVYKVNEELNARTTFWEKYIQLCLIIE